MITDRPLGYLHTKPGIDQGRYDMGDFELRYGKSFASDPVGSATVEDLAALMVSPNWEDRLRAEIVRARINVTLPDDFPCIYETPDSPHRSGTKDPEPNPWVVSPDIDMLTTLLPLYQELWDSYTNQWGPDSRRTFAVGRLDGLSVRGVYRPGATPEQVIGSTMLTHSRMYGTAPEHLRVMHPWHAQWTKGRAVR